MEYADFLFSQLFVDHIENTETKYRDLEYDLIFPEVERHNEEYKSSTYFLGMKGEYECILDYLQNKVK